VGARRSPTPGGSFLIRERLVPPNKRGTYGALAFGLSAYSRHRTDWPGGGQVGIHGTNQPQLIPGRISNGCVRMRNRDVLRLDRIVTPGTPVHVR
jgi:lipoprotein-anchoring transpeptidase ErfK/SrfK